LPVKLDGTWPEGFGYFVGNRQKKRNPIEGCVESTPIGGGWRRQRPGGYSSQNSTQNTGATLEEFLHSICCIARSFVRCATKILIREQFNHDLFDLTVFIDFNACFSSIA
jgi:hypothetical protein